MAETANTATKTTKAATDVRIEGLRGLSPNAVRFLRQHPRKARMAVAAALEAAALQIDDRQGARAGLSESLERFVVHRRPGRDTIGVSEAAARLEVSRTTVYDWVAKGTLLGWRSTKRGLTIPAEQILGLGKVVPGIGRVVEIIGDPELAWAFLSQEWPFTERAARPIDKLKAGEAEAVLDAAPGFGMTMT